MSGTDDGDTRPPDERAADALKELGIPDDLPFSSAWAKLLVVEQTLGMKPRNLSDLSYEEREILIDRFGLRIDL